MPGDGARGSQHREGERIPHMFILVLPGGQYRRTGIRRFQRRKGGVGQHPAAGSREVIGIGMIDDVKGNIRRRLLRQNPCAHKQTQTVIPGPIVHRIDKLRHRGMGP